jgi:uncharacterized LabA/DUF88 family protein
LSQPLGYAQGPPELRARGFFIGLLIMGNRVSFLVDGFNLYHSVRDAIADHRLSGGKWLDLRRLCRNFLSACGPGAQMQSVHYFSALAVHIDQQAPLRHLALINAMESTGVQVSLGQFKKKLIKCKAGCGRSGWGYEEKETDINIAVTLLELLMKDCCDIAVIISGDTDLLTAMRAAKRLFPEKKLGVGFPYKRAHKEMKQLADHSFKIDARYYEKFVFSDVIELPNGKTISKPVGW